MKKYISLILFVILLLTTFSCYENGGINTPRYDDYYYFVIELTDPQTRTSKIICDGFAPIPLPNQEKFSYTNGSELWIMNYDSSGNYRLLEKELSMSQYSFSADGNQVVFSTYNGLYHLYTINSDGTALRKVGDFTSKSELRPSFSPGSDKIVVCKDSGIAVINSDGTNFRIIKQRTDSVYYTSPAFLSDGKRIVFFENEIYFSSYTHNAALKIYDLESDSCFLILKNHPLTGIEVSDDDKIHFGQLFSFQFTGDHVSRIVDARNNFQVTDYPTGNHWASIRKDGTEIVTSDGLEIGVLKTAGGPYRLIRKDTTNSFMFPRFTSSGKILHQTSYKKKTD